MAATTSKPWNGSASRFTDQQYEASCIVKRGNKTDSKLPVKEPDGTINCNAVAAAKAAVAGARGANISLSSAERARLNAAASACSQNPLGVSSGVGG